MIYMWLTGINYYKLAVDSYVEKDRESIFTTIREPGLRAVMSPIVSLPYLWFHLNTSVCNSFVFS